jgi:hypothetical protein
MEMDNLNRYHTFSLLCCLLLFTVVVCFPRGLQALAYYEGTY